MNVPDWYASLSPKERRSHKDPLTVRVSFRARAGWCFLLLLPSLVICMFRLSHGARALPLLLGVIISAAFGYVLVASLTTRMTSTLQTGVHLRRAEPVRYWRDIAFLIVAYLFTLICAIQVNA